NKKPEYKWKLAATHHNYGLLLFDNKKYEQADDACSQALKLREELAKDFPNVPIYRQEVAWSHNSLAAMWDAKKKPEEAEKRCLQALTIFEQLVKDYPTNPDCLSGLGATLDNLAFFIRDLKRLSETRHYLEQALPHHLDALKPNP